MPLPIATFLQYHERAKHLQHSQHPAALHLLSCSQAFTYEAELPITHTELITRMDMQHVARVLLLLPTLMRWTTSYPPEHKTQEAASRQIRLWQKQYNHNIETALSNRTSGCTPDKIVYRQECFIYLAGIQCRETTYKTHRGSLSKSARVEYIEAVKCIRKKPAKSSLKDVPGARNRFDDFVATHIVATPYVHKDVRSLASLLHIYVF